ncbi:antifreeze protein Maxi-like [Asterias rubens]|uniref:antifreeze protein Maxi-like n=1 Tax=Asterias rubens TaxID=7604 RepID=UPI00145541F9|nr:antifreeze protein Maxi-like [Asterias rubens]
MVNEPTSGLGMNGDNKAASDLTPDYVDASLQLKQGAAATSTTANKTSSTNSSSSSNIRKTAAVVTATTTTEAAVVAAAAVIAAVISAAIAAAAATITSAAAVVVVAAAAIAAANNNNISSSSSSSSSSGSNDLAHRTRGLGARVYSTAAIGYIIGDRRVIIAPSSTRNRKRLKRSLQERPSEMNKRQIEMEFEMRQGDKEKWYNEDP